jgi:hypothetical protein
MVKTGVWKTVVAACAGLALASGAEAAPVPVDRCQQGVERYNANLDKMIVVLRDYTYCVGESRGRKACAAEFVKLRTAHVVLEAAVRVINTQCLPDEATSPPP